MLGKTRIALVLSLSLAVGAGGAALAVPAGADGSARKAVATTVKIKPLAAWQYDAEDEAYTVPGTVSSPRALCERNRKVKLEGPTVTLRDTTNRKGRWSVVLPVEETSGGTYKATALKKELRKNGRTIVCARAVDRYVLHEG